MTRTLTLASSALLFTAVAAQAQNPPAAATPAVQKVEVRGVARFGFDRTTVNPADGAKLMREVRAMQGVTWQTIKVTGHTDGVGSDQYNRKLSEKRAGAVREYLVEKAVKPEKISTAGMGEAEPLASNKTASGRAMNRRAEITFVGLRSAAAQGGK